MPRPIDYIMVPKGAEFKAIAKGLKAAASGKSVESAKTKTPLPIQLIALPAGPQPVITFLETWCRQHQAQITDKGTHPSPQILMMGLCGSLVPHHCVGDIVLYDRCLNGRLGNDAPVLGCDSVYSSSLRQILGNSVTNVTGIMCDRVIHEIATKKSLARQQSAQVVDMESYAALSVFKTYGMSAAILRVVSDDATRDLPDLNQAFDPEGNIRSWVLIRRFLAHPIGAYYLIKGSLSALKILKNLPLQILEPS